MIMKPKEIESAFAVIEELLHKYKINLLFIDEDLFVPEKTDDKFIKSKNKTYFYKKNDWKYIKTGNSGSTFFSPLFNDYIIGHKEMLLVISDGEIYDINKLKSYHPTLWLISGNRERKFTPPFGKVVEINT